MDQNETKQTKKKPNENKEKSKNIASHHHVTTSTMGCLLSFSGLCEEEYKNVVYFMQSLTSRTTSGVCLSKGF